MFKKSLAVTSERHHDALRTKIDMFVTPKIKTDAETHFYTGIQSIEMFNVILILIKPYLQYTVFWTALAKHRVTSTKIKKEKVRRN